jgi:hypothetical protein
MFEKGWAKGLLFVVPSAKLASFNFFKGWAKGLLFVVPSAKLASFNQVGTGPLFMFLMVSL